MCVCVYRYVCVYACMRVHVCMRVYVYVCMYVCICNVCMCVCVNDQIHYRPKPTPLQSTGRCELWSFTWCWWCYLSRHLRLQVRTFRTHAFLFFTPSHARWDRNGLACVIYVRTYIHTYIHTLQYTHNPPPIDPVCIRLVPAAGYGTKVDTQKVYQANNLVGYKGVQMKKDKAMITVCGRPCAGITRHMPLYLRPQSCTCTRTHTHTYSHTHARTNKQQTMHTHTFSHTHAQTSKQTNNAPPPNISLS